MVKKWSPDRLVLFVATGACSGLSPVAPGTAGSLVGVLLYLMIRGFGDAVFLILTVFITVCAVWVSSRAEALLQKKDPGEVVIDEIAGMLIALLFLPFSWRTVAIAFVVFRVLDIAKPFRILERLPRGWGIMMDDVAAAVATNVLLQIFI